jgi:ribonuclease HI
LSRAARDGAEPPEHPSREDLENLVAELRSVVARQENTIAQQRAAIDALQANCGQPSKPVATAAQRGTVAGAAAVGAPVGGSRARPTAGPVPGVDFTVVFDGGAIGNPGRGYGSYQIVGRDALVAERRLAYGDGVTNNQAEYLTLIRALEDLGGRLGGEAERAAVAVRGDSQLVVNQVSGRWKVKHPELAPLHRRAVDLLRDFGEVDVAWQPRSASVRVLGH